MNKEKNYKKEKSRHSKKPQVETKDQVSILLEPFKISKKELIFLIILLIVSCITRFYQLGEKSFWRDEFSTHLDAINIFNQKIFSMPHFFSFVLVNLSLKFGFNEITLRLPSCLAGILCVPAIYLLAKRIFGIHIAVISSLLVLFSPYQINFSQEARYYTEVTFISTLMMYFIILLIRKFDILYLLILLFLGILNYGVHPATAIFTISLLCFFLASFIYFGHHKYLFSLIKKSISYKIAFVIALAFTIFLIIIFRTLIHSQIKEIINRFILFPNIPFTEGVSFSLPFFLVLFKKFPINYAPPQLNYSWIVFFIFFILGVVYCVKYKKLYFVFLFCISYILTNIALFLFKAEIPFTEKYIIFLYPNLIILIAVGLYYLGALATKYVKEKLNRNVDLFVFPIFLTILVLSLNIPELKRIYTEEVFPTKPAVKYIKENGSPEDIILCSSFVYMEAIYYAPRFGINVGNIVDVDADDILRFYISLLQKINARKNMWLILTYTCGTKTSPQEFRDLLKPFFKLEKEFPSYSMPELWSHEIYKFQPDEPLISIVPTRFLLSNSKTNQNFQSGRYDYNFEFHPDVSESNLVFSKKIKILYSGNVYFTVNSLKNSDVQNISLNINNNKYLLQKNPGSDQYISPPINLSQSVYNAEFVIEPTNNLSQDFEFVAESNISIGCETERIIKSIFFSNKSPFLYPRYNKIAEGEIITVADKNGYLEWDFDVVKNGDYQVLIKGFNDKPDSIIVECDIDDKFLGILSFDGPDNNLIEKSLPAMNLDTGSHKIRLYFLNCVFEKTVMAINQVRLILKTGSEILNEDISPSLNLVTLDDNLVNLVGGKPIKPFWKLYCDTKSAKIKASETETVQIEVPYDMMEMIRFITNPIDINDKKNFYFKTNVKLKNLENHSFNVMFVSFGKDGKSITADWLYQTGYSRTIDWTKIPMFGTFPTKATQFVLAITVYANSKPTNKDTGYIYMQNPSFSPQ